MFTFYKVGARGRVQLEDIATEGDYYTVEKDADGTITLTPVEVKTTSTRQRAQQEAQDTQDRY